MKGLRNKIIIAIVVCAVLVGAFFYNGGTSKPDSQGESISNKVVQTGDNTSGELTCTISINCSTVLDNMDMLLEDKVSIVPSDGVILAEQTVPFTEGESVFDVLLRATKDNKIHMEFTNTPIYNSAYLEGIGNLYEFDCGELSGWQYRVNGVFPSYGCSKYILKPGDKIEWVYTCDLGKDVGGRQEFVEE